MVETPTLFAVFEERKVWERDHPELAEVGFGRFLEDEESLDVIVDEIRAANIPVHIWRYSKSNLSGLLLSLMSEPRSILWNLTDGHDIYHGSYFPAFVRLAGIPHLGSSSYAQILCQHKHHLKAVANSIGIAVARGMLFTKHSRRPLELESRIAAPYFVKPACLGNSIGDDLVNPICGDAVSALRAVENLFLANINEVLVEEFLPGEEFSLIALKGDRWFCECAQIHYSGPGYFSGTLKDAEEYAITFPEGPIADEVLTKGRLLASSLKLQDYYRIDFRLDAARQPRLLEINTHPFLLSEMFNALAKNNFGSRTEMFRQLIRQSYGRQSFKSAQNPQAAH